MKYPHFLPLGICLFAPLLPLAADDFSWIKTGSASSWTTGANWDQNAPPGTLDDVVTPTGFASIFLNFSTGTVASWTYNSGSNHTVYGGYDTVSTLTELNITGDLSKSGAGTLTFRDHLSDGARTLDLSVGSVTVSEGTLNITASSFQAGSASVSGGILQFNSEGARSIGGALVLSGSGIVSITGQGVVSPSQTTTLSVGSLSGASGTVRVNGNTSSPHTGNLRLTASTGSASFGGTITGGNAGAGNTLNVTKENGATQTLTGANNYTGATTVSGGALFVNGTHTGAGAYIVGGGVLGGNGSITSTGGVGLTLEDGGQLSAGGEAGSAGTLTLSLTGGTLDLSEGVGGANAGALLFDLGTTSDLITLNAGTLQIGAGELEFSDFSFSAISGFGAGTYTLFNTSSVISGSLGASLSGNIGAFTGTLSLADGNTDLILTVVPIPETGATLLLLAGLGSASLFWRRRVPQSM